MSNLQEQVLIRGNIKALSQFIILASLALFVPFFIHAQWLTGTIVNAILILTLFLVGVRSALVLCVVPSLMALAGGLLPIVLAPVLPFIMLSNMILILSIDYFYLHIKNNQIAYWPGLLAGSFLKFLFLFLSVNTVSHLLIKQALVVKIVQMFSYSQFYTAIIGGIIAGIILLRLKRI